MPHALERHFLFARIWDPVVGMPRAGCCTNIVMVLQQITSPHANHQDCSMPAERDADQPTLYSDLLSQSSQANNVSGSPTFTSGATYFQTHANTAPEAGCTFSACTPFTAVSFY